MCQKGVERFLPQRTQRRSCYELACSGIRVISNEGWRTFIVKARHYFRRRSALRGRDSMTCVIEDTGLFTPTMPRISDIANREFIANAFISGDGIEIGALHQPLRIPSGTRVKYVDKFPEEVLKKHYPELDSLPLVHVDIIDDGEILSRIGDSTQDFVIANHFLEHCRDPIGAIGNMLRVLKKDGVLYMAVPDKRFTFDAPRPTTSLQHLLEDHKDHGENSKRQAYEEWAKTFKELNHTADIAAETARLMYIDYSIHFHVWTQKEILELISSLEKYIDYRFELEFFTKIGIEVVVILRKNMNE